MQEPEGLGLAAIRQACDQQAHTSNVMHVSRQQLSEEPCVTVAYAISPARSSRATLLGLCSSTGAYKLTPQSEGKQGPRQLTIALLQAPQASRAMTMRHPTLWACAACQAGATPPTSCCLDSLGMHVPTAYRRCGSGGPSRPSCAAVNAQRSAGDACFGYCVTSCIRLASLLQVHTGSSWMG